MILLGISRNRKFNRNGLAGCSVECYIRRLFAATPLTKIASVAPPSGESTATDVVTFDPAALEALVGVMGYGGCRFIGCVLLTACETEGTQNHRGRNPTWDGGR